MIFYICHRKHAYTQAVILLYHRKDLQAFFRLIPYEDAHLLGDVSAGTVIWTDMDRLSADEVDDAAGISARLCAERPDIVQLNHPKESLQRFELLEKLYFEGINGFRVFRPDSLPDAIRYPVFVRDEEGATYKSPMLLDDRDELDRELAALPRSKMVRPMVVEFGTKPGADGRYRKYAAYRIGNGCYAQHCTSQKEWFVKYSYEEMSEADRQEQLSYVQDNPHWADLLPVFELAGISYGRIDYTMVDGKVQVFEINTNPTILSSPPDEPDELSSMRYADMHFDALRALPHAADPSSSAKIEETHARMLKAIRRKMYRHRFRSWPRRSAKKLARFLAAR